MASITIDLSPEVEVFLRRAAADRNLDERDYVRRLIEEDVVPRTPSAAELLTLSPEEREPYLVAAAAALEEDYRSDLARPSDERELTALTALDGEPFHDDTEAQTG
jgi:hypothetical protein